MIKRKADHPISDFLLHDKRALLVTGARQVGKTFLIRKVGKKCFEHVVEINFVEQPDAVELFNGQKGVTEGLNRAGRGGHLDRKTVLIPPRRASL